ncbi:MAG: glycine hydroxymethyltransferase [Treponema sp.]|jgi:glycine hydroxymethyltransferase|nr:glycine hydroxymethyltransferase [Treponema sp.]
MINPIIDYLSSTAPENVNNTVLMYLGNLTQVASIAPDIACSIVKELEGQRNRLKLVASENYCSLAVQGAMGNLLTDKYAEGIPYHRFYAGTENVDSIEEIAIKEACELFDAEYANVQPHCGADANLMAYWAILMTRVENQILKQYKETNLYKLTASQWQELRTALGNQRLLGLDYYSGGHLTHGYRSNISGRMFDSYSYTVSKETGLLDYDSIEHQAMEVQPLILLAGFSAYPRKIDFRRLRTIADKIGAVLMVDMAHFAGLVAGKVLTGNYNPVPYAHVVTSTTHKTLRGPRAGLVLAKREFAEALDKGCPLVMGGPLPHVIAAKAIAFREARSAEFQQYAANIVKNCQRLAQVCMDNGIEVLTGGTDNHLFLANVRSLGLTGRQAERALFDCNITLNRNSLPFDPNGPWYTSGLRLGTAALTTLGMGEAEMDEVGAIIAYILKHVEAAPDLKELSQKSRASYSINPEVYRKALSKVKSLLSHFPVYPELDLDLLKKFFVK